MTSLPEDHGGWASPLLVWAGAGWIAALVGWHAVDVTGTVIGPRNPWAMVGVAVIGLGVVAMVTIDRRTAWGSWRLTGLGVMLVAVVLAGLAGHRRMAMAEGPLQDLAARGGSATAAATVATEPVLRPDGSAWMLVTVTSVDGTTGRWRALLAGQDDPAPVGSRLRMVVTARPLADEGFEASLRRRHAVVAVTPLRLEVVAAPSGVLGVVEHVRARIRRAADTGLGGDAAGLAVGLVTGDTRQLSATADDDMRAAGLSHLVAVSGSNVALVAGAVASLVASLGARLRRLVVAAAILAFVVTTRAEPSVLRAGAMAGAVMAVRTVGRPTMAMHALAVTVIVLLAADPASAGSLGLVLSVGATVGVLVVAPVVARRLPARIPAALAGLVAATVGAQVAVAPLLLVVTGTVPLAALPANFVAVPSAAVGSMVAVLGAVVAQFDVARGGNVMAIAGPPLHVILGVARASVGGPVVATAAPVGLALATIVTTAVLASRGGRVRRWSLRVAVLGVVVVGGANLPTGWRPPPHLAITAIDVGQGDALLVTTASGNRMLVDAGRDHRAADWLREHGIRSLDLVVVTHGDADHAGGLDELLATVDVATIWVSATPEGGASSVWARDWRDRDGPIPPEPAGVVAVTAGRRARLGSAVVEVLGPPGGYQLVATEGGRNDRSVVVRIEEGPRTVLVPGDVEHAAQQWLLDNVADLAVDVLVVPHHGAATSEHELLRATDARVAIVSVGADNDYGHPHHEVLAVLADMGASVHRTDLAGTVVVEVPP